MVSTALTTALTTLQETEQQLVVELEATRRAIAAIQEIAALPAAATRVREDADRGPRPRPRTTGVPVAELARTAASRDRALLTLIAGGTRSRSALRSALPLEPGVTERQHKSAVSNTLTRLSRQGLIVRTTDGWELTAKGRKAAGAPAKEAP
ncbi:MAG TPA: hypothetical protein VM364_00725 [Vicinamibacterales bacterium]|nr:hypothetical protein [Vicinamibacterales bacterium]